MLGATKVGIGQVIQMLKTGSVPQVQTERLFRGEPARQWADRRCATGGAGHDAGRKAATGSTRLDDVVVGREERASARPPAGLVLEDSDSGHARLALASGRRVAAT